MKDRQMASTKIPPAKAARVVERARHHLNRLQQRMVPPHAAMMDVITGAWTAAQHDVGVGYLAESEPLGRVYDELVAVGKLGG
jgi:hypothetical protein